MIREWNERDRQLAVIRVARIVKSLDKSYFSFFFRSLKTENDGVYALAALSKPKPAQRGRRASGIHFEDAFFRLARAEKPRCEGSGRTAAEHDAGRAETRSDARFQSVELRQRESA